MVYGESFSLEKLRFGFLVRKQTLQKSDQEVVERERWILAIRFHSPMGWIYFCCWIVSINQA